jgi:diguanylate cyclase (GGDEF)-like protein/PAS domain S-box-containing protein
VAQSSEVVTARSNALDASIQHTLNTSNVAAREAISNTLSTQALRQYQTMLEHFPNGAIFMFDHELRYTVARGAGLALASLTSETFEGKTIWEIWPPEIAQRDAPVLQAALQGIASVVEVPYEGKTVEVQTLPIRDEHGAVIGGMVVTQEITERKRAEEALRLQALYDPLTQLPNRMLLRDRLDRAEARAQRSPHTSVALLFLDLDHFKTINDNYGHVTGDAILVEAARRMETCVRPGDTVARLGGDEFVVLLEDMEDMSAATVVAERLIAAFDAAIAVDHHQIHLGVSIGIAGANQDINPSTLLHQGDAAMYAAKKAGRDRYVLYDAVRHEAIFTAEHWKRTHTNDTEVPLSTSHP